ncbi:restriction endonuclease [Myxococcus xanthus]|uniref:HTH domain-containing protein n=1 Tax=Myxococcus xanthus TaxID=34 RepID=UPI0019176923|nr:HTH domain-containing protein [Myxococcus xanthus]QQR41648.1 restriction endonuclease [Myxococcus xanthus]
MTFYEAALRILESEGRPLHFLEITEKSIQQSLLSHVGKTPEVTMLSRLAAMARRTRDRKVLVTAKDTFALVDWSIPEDVEALAQTGVVEPHPEEELPPLRPPERHPEPRTDNVRVAGRGSDRKRRRDEEEERGGRRKRFPPLPEVVFEILSESDIGLRTEQIIERARVKELCGEDTTVEAVLTALLEDNQRRIDAGRRPQYAFSKDSGEVSLERAGAPSEAPPLELQAAFAQALGIPLEAGRPVLGKPAAAGEAPADAALVSTLRAALKDARRSVARGLRKRLGELDVGTFEKSVVKMMHGLGFRELKVAKRSKEGPLLTARKREGSVELRYAVRMLKGTPGIDRKSVQELRRDLGHYSAQVGLLVSAGDVRGDARTEAQANGSLVMLWCGDALGEKFLEAETAVSVTQVALYEVDEKFFEAAKLDAEEAQKRREERQREKQAREGEEPTEAAAPTERERPREKRRRERESREAREAREAEATAGASTEETSAAPAGDAREAAPVPAAPVLQGREDDEEGDDEDGEDDDLEAASAFVGGARPDGTPAEAGAEGAQGDRKRRRRRRRGRRGRGSRAGEAGATGAPGEAGAAGEAAAAVEAGASVAVEAGALVAGAVGAAADEAGASAVGAGGDTVAGDVAGEATPVGATGVSTAGAGATGVESPAATGAGEAPPVSESVEASADSGEGSAAAPGAVSGEAIASAGDGAGSGAVSGEAASASVGVATQADVSGTVPSEVTSSAAPTSGQTQAGVPDGSAGEVAPGTATTTSSGFVEGAQVSEPASSPTDGEPSADSSVPAKGPSGERDS